MGGNIPMIEAHGHVIPPCVRQAVHAMDKHNIEALVDMTPYTGVRGVDFPGPFTMEESLKAFNKFPGRFIPFCGINFEGFGTRGWLEREMEALDRYLDAGAIGIKLWKTLGLSTLDNEGKVVRVDDERLAPLLDYAQEAGAVLAFHVADPQGFFQPMTLDNERLPVLKARPEWWFGDRERYPYDWWQLIKQLERVIARHKKGIIIGAHFGSAAEEMDYVADVMRRHPHYVIDVAARLQDIGRYDPARVVEFFTEFQDRILFATDAFFDDPGREPEYAAFLWNKYREYFETEHRDMENPSRLLKWRIHAVGLNSDILAKIYHLNARRYLVDGQ